jgi:hypothetical protein
MGVLLRRLMSAFRRDRFDRELREEMQLHLDLRAAELREAGLEDRDAGAAARKTFGNVLLLREEAREMWGFRFLETLAQDLRYAFRQIRENPGFTAVAAATFALGIGANTAIFSLVDAVILRPLAYRQPERLFVIHEVVPKFNFGMFLPVNALHFQQWQKHGDSFEQMALLNGITVNLSGDGDPERLPAARVSPNLFAILGVQAQVGRTFLSDEDQPGRAKVVVLSNELWRRRFNADPGVINRTINLPGGAAQIIGVLSATFRFPKLGQLYGMAIAADRPQLWIPLVLDNSDLRPTGGYNFATIARLRAGVSPSKALAELNAIQADTENLLPEKYDLRAALVPLQDQITASPGRV